MNLYLFFFWSLFLLLQTLCKRGLVVEGLGCNWGTRATHPLPPDIVVRLLKDNGFNKVKLFEAEAEPLKALGNSGIQVMIGIPNDYLAALSSSVKAAEDWVQENVSSYVSKYGVDVRYVAVGNEPFLSFYKNMFQGVTFPALKNIQAALIKAGLAKKVKVTVPLNADVYQSASNLPSGGDFRADIHSLMISIIKFLSDNGSPLAINIYPFLSLYADPDFPIDFAFFPNSTNATPSHPLVDGSITYTNVFEANYDTLIWALEKNGFPSMPVIIGEVGWPTDGDPNANLANAQRFNQGLVDRIVRGQGSPKRPSPAPDVYLFGLIDEDAKSVQPGNFERHWGIFYYDGTVKYNLNLGRGKNLVPAKGVKYLSRQWCVMAPEASLGDPNLVAGITYACTYADCTSLGYGSTCGKLDAKSNASFAFNIYFQTLNQQKGACQFNNLAKVTTVDPSQGTCRFEIMIDVGKHERSRNGTTTTTSSSAASPTSNPLLLLLVFVVTSLMIIKMI